MEIQQSTPINEASASEQTFVFAKCFPVDSGVGREPPKNWNFMQISRAIVVHSSVRSNVDKQKVFNDALSIMLRQGSHNERQIN
jgi:hypothetical protein